MDICFFWICQNHDSMKSIPPWPLLIFLALSISSGSLTAAPATLGGSVFQTSPTYPKYNTGHLEFRDPSGKKWPVFFFGKPSTSGRLDLAPQKPLLRLSWTFDQRSQRLGDQSRRVLGELLTATNLPVVSLELTQITGLKPVTGNAGVSGKDLEGQVQGTLTLGKKIPIVGKAIFKFQDPKVDQRNPGVMVEILFTFSSADLELKQMTGPIDGRISLTAYRDAKPATMTP